MLQELAKKFKKEKNLVIAKMDASANDTPKEYPVEGFPTIYFATRYVLYMLPEREEREQIQRLLFIYICNFIIFLFLSNFADIKRRIQSNMMENEISTLSSNSCRNTAQCCHLQLKHLKMNYRRHRSQHQSSTRISFS